MTKQNDTSKFRKEKESQIAQRDRLSKMANSSESLANLAIRVFLDEFDTRYWVHVESCKLAEGMNPKNLEFASIKGQLFDRKISPEYISMDDFLVSEKEAGREVDPKSSKAYFGRLFRNREITSLTAQKDIKEQKAVGVTGIPYELSGQMVQILGEKAKNYKLDYARLC